MGAEVLFQNGGAQSRDVLTLIAGEYLGGGASRDVWQSAWNPNLVVKRETVNPRHRFQNHAEWNVWQSVRDNSELAKWFSPCVHVSESGLWLLQHRTTPVTLLELQKEVPFVPSFFTDLKVANWGRSVLSGRIVCHDYGLLLTVERGLSNRMKRAKWWVERPS
jgi:hypothetical protein